MNITKIIFSASHLYAINPNYMQCLGLGNRAEASLFYVAKGNFHKSYRRELQHWLLKRFIIHSALQLFFDWPESLQWIFKVSACDIKTCRLYNSHVKVTGNHVMYDRSAWFLRVIIMSSSCALCCLPSVKKQKYDSWVCFVDRARHWKNSWRQGPFSFRWMYNKTIIRCGFWYPE